MAREPSGAGAGLPWWMDEVERRRSRRRWHAASVLTGCPAGGDRAAGGVRGAQREPALAVGAVSFAETRQARPGADPVDAPLAMRPPAGERYLTDFGYTFCPDVCPTTLADVGAAVDQLGEWAGRVSVVMVTADPARDSLDVLTQYVGHFVDRFVAVRPRDAAELRTAESAFLASSSVATNASGDIEVAHTATLYLVDHTGSVRVEWPFGTTAETIAHDVRLVLEPS